MLLVRESDGIDATTLTAALAARVKRARSPLKLPTSMTSPGPEWGKGYPTFAAECTRTLEQFRELIRRYASSAAASIQFSPANHQGQVGPIRTTLGHLNRSRWVI